MQTKVEPEPDSKASTAGTGNNLEPQAELIQMPVVDLTIDKADRNPSSEKIPVIDLTSNLPVHPNLDAHIDIKDPAPSTKPQVDIYIDSITPQVLIEASKK